MITFIESLKDGTSIPGPAKLNAWVYNSVFFYFFYICLHVSQNIFLQMNIYVYILVLKKLPRVVNIRQKKTIETFHLYMSNANVKSIKWPGSIMHPGCAAFQAATRPGGSTRQTAKVKASTCLDHGHSQTQTRLNKSSSLPMFVVSRFFKERTPYVTNKQGSKCGHKNSYKKMPPWHIPRSPCCSLATSTTTVFPHHAMAQMKRL